MSHNVKLKDTNFTDLNILRAAVSELTKEGSPFTWAEGPGTTMRGAFAGVDRYNTQEVEACIKIADGNTGSYGNWDIGFKWNAEERKYDVITDSDLPGFGQRLGVGASADAKSISGEFCRTDNNSRMLGRLIQRYNLIRDERTAAMQNYMTRRIPAKDGMIVLEATRR
jgi:hypothetical protein